MVVKCPFILSDSFPIRVFLNHCALCKIKYVKKRRENIHGSIALLSGGRQHLERQYSRQLSYAKVKYLPGSTEFFTTKSPCIYAGQSYGIKSPP